MARRVYMSLVDADLTAAEPLRLSVGDSRTGIEFLEHTPKIPFHSPDAEPIRQRLLAQIREVAATVCMIGGTTHTSAWVDWEIDTSLRLGRGLVGVRLRTGTHDFVPRSLRFAGAQIVDAQVASIIASIDRAILVTGSSTG